MTSAWSIKLMIPISPAHGGLPGMVFYNTKREPSEKYGQLYSGLFELAPIQLTMRQHMGRVARFSHRPSETPEGAVLTPHD
jgi:hypothetical protein